MIAFLLGSLWALPAASAAGSFLMVLAFGGDWQLAGIAAVTLGLAALAFRLLGAKGALGVLTVGAILFAHRRGERRGEMTQAARERKNAAEAIDEIRRTRDDALRRQSDPERLRDDDGFRRD